MVFVLRMGTPSLPRQAEMWKQGWLERGVVPSVECGGGVGGMPQVQDVFHCPFELDMLDS